MDLERYRIRPGDKLLANRPQRKRRLPRPKPGEWFLRGPIPGNWLAKAAALPGKALHVAMAAWHLGQLAKSDTVPLSHSAAAQFGATRDALRRSLPHLERAGLVRVERRAGRSPRVTIVCSKSREIGE